ncbi:abortive infection system antitoxin AbiGi family protein [Vibrio pacinii]|uniref:abortive infection system antitoxin AbiGi family protein n=1 Tax=Vibrio pacinii TaxID=170674 RepID=UPI001FDF0A29|nr:abortive infection system antitoxin AbiGi family protein [Vibrio pacinii]
MTTTLPMVCFCDIPLSRIGEHVKFYGEFGLGMSREWAERNGLNPIMYLLPNSKLASAMKAVDLNVEKLDDESALKEMEYVLSYCKPVVGEMTINGRVETKEFFQESEWRFIPVNHNIESYLIEFEYENPSKLEEENQKTKEFTSLTLEPNDVKYIFVKKDSDIPEMIKFIQSEMDDFVSSDIKVLMSRVISLESISNDM